MKKPPMWRDHDEQVARVREIIADEIDAEEAFWFAEMELREHPPRRVVPAQARKRPRGRPLRTTSDLEVDPKHVAAKQIEKIVDILHGFYPKQRGIVQRAIFIAEELAAERAEELAAKLGIEVDELHPDHKIDSDKLRSYRYSSPHAPPIKLPRRGRWK